MQTESANRLPIVDFPLHDKTNEMGSYVVLSAKWGDRYGSSNTSRKLQKSSTFNGKSETC